MSTPIYSQFQASAATYTVSSALQGIVLITYNGDCAISLLPPVAGSPASGGDDGAYLSITSATPRKHMVTASVAGKLSGFTLASFSNVVGSYLTLWAQGGQWQVVAQAGITLT